MNIIIISNINKIPLTQALFYLNNKNNFVLPKIPKSMIRVSGGWTG
jgi:hypothetical protein